MSKLSRACRWLPLALVALAVELAATDSARLVRDINPATGSAYPHLLAEHDDKVFFYLSGERPGLWASDGTAAGTLRLASFIGSSPWSYPGPVVSAGDHAYFTKRDSVLWKTDGTREGTAPVFKFEVFYCGYKCVAGPQVLGAVGDRVFVSAYEHRGGFELWVSDGTAAGTRRVRDIVPGPSSSFPYGFAATSGRAYFIADDGVHGHELWVTDGSAGGTRMVADLKVAGSSQPRELTALGDTLLFTADNGHGRELWATEGTPATTRLVRRIDKAPRGNSDPRQLTVMDGELYFIAWDGRRYRLWKSDGTGAGTVPVGAAGADGSTPMVAAGERLFFSASRPETGYELWVSDGSEAGTRLVKDIRPGREGSNIGGILDPPSFTALGDDVYFAAADGVHGYELWTSDGTEAGTVLVEDLWPGPDSSDPFWLTRAGDRVFFAASDGRTGRELWSTAAGGRPALLEDFDGANQSSYPQALLAVGERLFFSANDGLTGSELWVTDGSTAGTRGFDLCPGSCSSLYSNHPLAAVAGALFFAAEDGERGAELWTSDGTDEGTRLVADLSPTSSHPGGFSNQTVAFTALGDRLLFGAATPATGVELWASDGSEAGTGLVADIRPGERGSEPDDAAAVGDRLFFTADDGVVGRELWVTDGSAGGTELVADIRAGGGESRPFHLAPLAGRLVFTADDGTDRELWVSDGTAAGTFEITDIDPERGDWRIDEVAVAGEAVFLLAGSYRDGSSLWVTDGTPGGERRLRTFAGYDRADGLTAVGSRVFLVASDEAGRELWASDGTADGTRRVRDINPGPGSSYPDNLIAIRGLLYFKAYDRNASDSSLWQSDGTAAGTRPVLDLGPSSELAYLQQLTPLGDELFFTAYHPRHGNELFALDLAAASGAGVARALRDRHRPGGPELVAVAPGGDSARVFDALTGAPVASLPTGAESLWQVVDLAVHESAGVPPRVAILTRRGNSGRVRLHDAATGEPVTGWRLERGLRPLALAPVPGSDALAVLTLAAGATSEVRVFAATSGVELARHDFSDLGDPIDLEALSIAGEPAVAVLAVGTYTRRAAVRVRETPSGAPLGEWLVDRPFEPEDLEVLPPVERGAAPRLAVLGSTPRRRGVRVLVAEPGGDRVEVVRFGRRDEALDLEIGGGDLLSVLLAGDGGASTRVVTREARGGRKLRTVRFADTREALDLALLPRRSGAPPSGLAVLGRAECAGGGFAITVRDLATGELGSCFALAAAAPD